MVNTLIIHHADPDGYAAAWAAWKVFGDTAHYYPIQYKEPLPKKLEYNTYMLDFSLPRDQMIQMKKMCPGFVCIDHHKTAKEACEGLDFCIFDMDKSGCELAWEYFHPNVEMPQLSLYIGDRDLWKFEMPDSHVINAAIMSYDLDFKIFNDLNRQLSHADLKKQIIAEGEAIERAKQQYIKLMSRHAEVVLLPNEFGEFAGEKCVIVNAPYVGISDLLHSLCDDHGVPAIGYFRRANGIWQYSFRSTNEIGAISNWAKVIGGGGHPLAAGAESSTLVFEQVCSDCGGQH